MMSKLQDLALETAVYLGMILVGLWFIAPMMSSSWLVVVGLLSVGAFVGAVMVALGIFLENARQQKRLE